MKQSRWPSSPARAAPCSGRCRERFTGPPPCRASPPVRALVQETPSQWNPRYQTHFPLPAGRACATTAASSRARRCRAITTPWSGSSRSGPRRRASPSSGCGGARGDDGQGHHDQHPVTAGHHRPRRVPQRATTTRACSHAHRAGYSGASPRPTARSLPSWPPPSGSSSRTRRLRSRPLPPLRPNRQVLARRPAAHRRARAGQDRPRAGQGRRRGERGPRAGRRRGEEDAERAQEPHGGQGLEFSAVEGADVNRGHGWSSSGRARRFFSQSNGSMASCR